MEHSYEYVMLYPEQIKKDPKYQREIDVARIKKITKNWDDDLVNAPKVSLRENGNYYVFNGQHTLAAWKKRYGNKMIQCKVYRGLTETEEKDLFVKQEGFSKAVGLVDKLRAEYNSGNDEVMDMKKGSRSRQLYQHPRHPAPFVLWRLQGIPGRIPQGHEVFVQALCRQDHRQADDHGSSEAAC